MRKSSGKVKLLIFAAVVPAILYLIHTIPSPEQYRLRAPAPLKPVNREKLYSYFGTQFGREKNSTGLAPLINRVSSFSEESNIVGVSFGSGHLDLQPGTSPSKLYTKTNYSDSRLLYYTTPGVKYGEGTANLANCYKIGEEEGKNVSVLQYRNCMKIILRDYSVKVKSLENNENLLRMTGRRRVYEDACRLPAVEVTGAPNFQDVVYEATHKLSYCKTAKAGSSTVLSFIFYISSVEFDPKSEVGLHDAARATFPALPGHGGALKMTTDAFSFTSVRHPFRRLVSAYCNKILEGKEEILKQHNSVMLSYRLTDTVDIVKKDLPTHRFEMLSNNMKKSSVLKFTRKFILSTPGKEKYLEDASESETLVPGVPSFREFMLFAALSILHCAGDHICLSALDTHFRPQVIRCNPCAWHFDFILKTETLQEDLVWLARVVGASVSHQQRTHLTENIPRLNKSGSRCRSYDHYMHALTSEEIDLFYSAYYNDFRYFGYEPFD